MARIVNLGILAPKDIDFVTGDGSVFRVSGSILMSSMITLARLEQSLAEVQAEAAALQERKDDEGQEGYRRAGADALDVLEDLQAEVLKLLQVHQPELEEVPFTQHELGAFLAALRSDLDEQAGVPPTSPPSTTTGNRAARRASTRSSGSRASSSSSASRRTTGGK